VKIAFYGAAGTVTGSCFLVKTENTNFLVDCGMFQGSKELKERNYDKFLFNPEEIDFVLLTHAHVDHCGLIPKLYKFGFQGPVYATKATSELCAVVLPDSAHIQEMEVERKNRKNLRSGRPLLEPIYTVMDAEACLDKFKGVSYEEMIEVSPGIKVVFQDAGHVLGSAIIEICITEDGIEKKIVFTGDLGNINQPILDDPTNIKKTDVLVMESTYGNRYHFNADNKLEELASVIKATMKKGGNLIVPSFAVERTQDLIYELKVLLDEGKIPSVNIYVDSPMAIEATQVFINNHEFCTDERFAKVCGLEGKKCFEEFKNLHYALSVEDSMALNRLKGGAIIISASGMADAGRIKHHLKHNLWRQESTILFVGYQAQGTLGRRILEGEKKVRIHGEEVAVKADIVKIEGFSAHADQKGLVEWVKAFNEKPKEIFLVHGEEAALDNLQRVIAGEVGIQARIPEIGSQYDLSQESLSKVATFEQLSHVQIKPELNEAFIAIKEQLEDIAKMPGKDTRTLQRLLAQVNEIEREIGKVG
jgi:metallo-beta-lactamase family protein